MSNGLGAGFFALTLLAVIGGMAFLVLFAMTGSVLYHRRTGHVPVFVCYLLVMLCLGVLGVAGFGITLLFDEAPAVGWLLASTVVVPLLIVGSYLARTTGFTRFTVITTTVMAWGGSFILGVIVVFGLMNGIDMVFDLAPAQSRQFGVPWIAATVGGLTIIISMLPLANRLGKIMHSAAGDR